jgi:hypothetical protein
MFDDTTTTQPLAHRDDPGPSKWRCSKCRTEPRGTPRDQLLDARDRWRRDWCQSCRRKTFMERA